MGSFKNRELDYEMDQVRRIAIGDLNYKYALRSYDFYDYLKGVAIQNEMFIKWSIAIPCIITILIFFIYTIYVIFEVKAMRFFYKTLFQTEVRIIFKISIGGILGLYNQHLSQESKGIEVYALRGESLRRPSEESYSERQRSSNNPKLREEEPKKERKSKTPSEQKHLRVYEINLYIRSHNRFDNKHAIFLLSDPLTKRE